MNSDIKIGAGLVGQMALCCGGPLIVSLITSGVLLGALGTLWAGGELLLLLSGAVLIVAGAWLFARRRSGDAPGQAACCAPEPSSASGADAGESVPRNDEVPAR